MEISTNFRPISVPSAFTKILKCSYSPRLNIYLEQTKIISSRQHGFETRRSASTTIHLYSYKIFRSDRVSVEVFCDLCRTFDCVDHIELINKLYRLGVSVIWIGQNSFFTNESLTGRVYRGIYKLRLLFWCWGTTQNYSRADTVSFIYQWTWFYTSCGFFNICWRYITHFN